MKHAMGHAFSRIRPGSLQKWSNGARHGPGLPLSPAPDRPVSGISGQGFPGNPDLTSDGETGGFARRKTGLFGAVWMEYLRPPRAEGGGGGARGRRAFGTSV